MSKPLLLVLDLLVDRRVRLPVRDALDQEFKGFQGKLRMGWLSGLTWSTEVVLWRKFHAT
jgi:hypothetical protein